MYIKVASEKNLSVPCNFSQNSESVDSVQVLKRNLPKAFPNWFPA